MRQEEQLSYMQQAKDSNKEEEDNEKAEENKTKEGKLKEKKGEKRKESRKSAAGKQEVSSLRQTACRCCRTRCILQLRCLLPAVHIIGAQAESELACAQPMLLQHNACHWPHPYSSPWPPDICATEWTLVLTRRSCCINSTHSKRLGGVGLGVTWGQPGVQA